MFRMLFVTFYGKFRGTHEQEHHLHESPPSMTIPLIILAFFSIVGGLLGLPEFWHFTNWMSENLDSVILRSHRSKLDHETEWMLMGLAVIAAAASIYAAYEIYKKNGLVPDEREYAKTKWKNTIYHKFYIDEIYDALIRKPIDYLSGIFHKIFDIQIFDNIVNGVSTFTRNAGSYARLIQNGNIGFYFIGMVIAVAVILIFTFLI